jgi:integrase
MPVRQRGNRWQADVVVPGGKRYRRQFPNQTEATIWEAEARVCVLKGEEPVLASGTGPEADPDRPQTLGQLRDTCWTRFWEKSKSQKYIEHSVDLPLEFFGRDFLIKNMNEAQIERYILHLQGRANSNTTINRKVGYLLCQLRYAQKCGWIIRAPVVKRLRMGHGRTRWFTLEEERRILHWFYSRGQGEAHDLLLFLADTGWRLREAWTMTWDLVDLTREVVTVPAEQAKNGKPRTTPMTPRVAAMLQARGLSSTHQRVFGPLSLSRLYGHWQDMKLDLGLDRDEEVVIHTFRHTCASRLVQAGVDLYVVSQWLGHNSMAQTRRYAHLAPQTLAGARDVLAGVLSGQRS